MTTCSIDDCSTKAKARGWCHKHYKRWQLHGDPLIKHETRGKRRSPDSVLVGEKFGRWVVVGPYIRQADGQARFPCKCECGTEREVLWRGMREFGSCGCAQKDAMLKLRKYGEEPGTAEWNKARWLWQTYKITADEWQSMYDKQQGLCAICSDDLSEGRIHLDHNHKTGSVRSLLCHHCNVGIGHFKEDVNILLKAIAYLQAER